VVVASCRLVSGPVVEEALGGHTVTAGTVVVGRSGRAGAGVGRREVDRVCREGDT
jgi:hypothetical protein